MWPDRVSNPGHLTYESGVLLTALRGPAQLKTCQDGKGLLRIHLWCPEDRQMLWDRIE